MTGKPSRGKPRSMDNRPPPIVVRPRKGSDLEKAQIDHQNKLADVLHSWATQFALSKTGEKEDEH